VKNRDPKSAVKISKAYSVADFNDHGDLLTDLYATDFGQFDIWRWLWPAESNSLGHRG
jgi:hypothetical protein